MKKRMIAALLTLLLLSQPLLALADSSPLIYRVTDDQGHKIDLLGTIHVGVKDMYPLGEAVESAFEEADVLAVEVNLQSLLNNMAALIKTSVALVYGVGDDVTNHISPETYQLGVEKLGYPEFLLRRMKPIAWYTLAENNSYLAAGLDTDLGVDNHLLLRAKKAGKQVDELESMDLQMATLLSFPDQVMDEQIRLELTYPEETAESLKTLLNAWRQGDAETLEAILSQEEESGQGDSAYQEFNDSLIYTRNDGFEEKAIAYLNNGTVAMIAIGAFHILGPDGLAARLERAGYHVEEIGRGK